MTIAVTPFSTSRQANSTLSLLTLMYEVLSYFLLNLLSAFADTSCFTGKVTQIVKFCTANNTAACNFDFINSGAVQRESSFYAYTVRYTAYSKGFTNTAAAARNNNAFKHLNAFTAAFNYLYINFYSVACTKSGMSERSCSCSKTSIMFIISSSIIDVHVRTLHSGPSVLHRGYYIIACLYFANTFAIYFATRLRLPGGQV